MVSFPQVSPSKPCVHFNTPYVLHASPISFFPIFDHRKNIDWKYLSLNSSYNSLHCTVTTSLLGPNILLNTLFSNTLNRRPSLNGSDEFSRITKRKQKIAILFKLIFIFLEMNSGRHEKLNVMIASTICFQSALSFFLNFNTSTVSKEIFSIFILWLRLESWVSSFLTSLLESQHN